MPSHPQDCEVRRSTKEDTDGLGAGRPVKGRCCTEVLSTTDQLYHTGVKFNLQIEGSCAQSEKEGIPVGEAGLNKGTVRRKCEDCRGISKEISAAGVWAGWWGELGKEHRKEV